MSHTSSIEIWDIEKIIPYEANAKKHPKEQVKKLAQAITKFGWTQPIVVDVDGVIIAGHGRRLAALELKLTKVPVIHRADLTKAEADALRLADNRVASTDYDQALIQDELRRLADELEGSQITLLDIGFDEKELEFTMSDLGEVNDDFFVEDVGEAVEQQKKENAKAIEATDDVAAPIGDAFGFKRVSIAQSRAIREMMSTIETSTGKVGPEALILFLSDALNRK
ncbi:ParB/Srx family N-terminal domain-containing protein [Ancylobacter rudongensis]|uniref:ParB-like nuclease domain-containing protein n=1 Tax=Ancylobacter rudongensis TaxID=177413 RepID=A0A1G4US06_9HYPH|nr:ParB/Srx family N-terminal domain-containing protein [Ancylobacter rudongensis]SCW95589.1 ParB-like nuclease domain-containing protein [Ancylobacter rudongensis]